MKPRERAELLAICFSRGGVRGCCCEGHSLRALVHGASISSVVVRLFEGGVQRRPLTEKATHAQYWVACMRSCMCLQRGCCSRLCGGCLFVGASIACTPLLPPPARSGPISPSPPPPCDRATPLAALSCVMCMGFSGGYEALVCFRRLYFKRGARSSFWSRVRRVRQASSCVTRYNPPQHQPPRTPASHPTCTTMPSSRLMGDPCAAEARLGALARLCQPKTKRQIWAPLRASRMSCRSAAACTRLCVCVAGWHRAVGWFRGLVCTGWSAD